MRQRTMLCLALTLALFVFVPPAARSGELAAHHAGALESAGVPVYPGASFLTSNEDDHIVLWFLSADSPDTIMDWYGENLPEWSAATISGMRVIYKGPAGLDQEGIMAVPYVFVSSGEQLGHGPDHGNEITIRIPAAP